jgi:phage shock protein A
MGIFTRFRDIIHANINDMLDHSEKPDELIKQIIREIEETLVELKASCAREMAEKKRIIRQMAQLDDEITKWVGKARDALENEMEDDAREALRKKYHAAKRFGEFQKNRDHKTEIIAHYQTDIERLQEKLDNARKKQRFFVYRQGWEKNNNSGLPDRIEECENRMADIERKGATESPYPTALESKFESLTMNEDVEMELETLKLTLKGKSNIK